MSVSLIFVGSESFRCILEHLEKKVGVWRSEERVHRNGTYGTSNEVNDDCRDGGVDASD